MRRHHSLLLVGVLVGVLTLLAVDRVFAAEPVWLTLAIQGQPDGTVLLTATVTDAKRAPVPDAAVTFQAKTTFGWLVVGEVTTDRAGAARVVLPQAPRSGEIAAETDAGAKTLRAAKWIDRASPPEPGTRPGYAVLSELSPQPGFISPYPVPLEVMLLIVVLGGIWVTYVYLVFVLMKIRRAPTGPGPAGWRARESQWR